MENLNEELIFNMMQDKDNRDNVCEGETVNNLNSPNEDNICANELAPDVYKRISELTDEDISIRFNIHSTMLHGMNSFANAPQNFTNALNEVERKAGLDTKCFNPTEL
ncbi:DUF2225 domain-containing protein [Sesbania bispinosa]|nr:DUF2225 domain-containing protein [Sesbania bispinosa]